MANVSLFHEAPLEVLREEPNALLDLLRVAGVEIPTRAIVQPLETELVDATPMVRRPDFVALLKPPGEDATEVVVFEVQRDRDQEKPLAWLDYIALLHRKHRLPVRVLVLVFDRDVARWARQPYTFGEGIVYRIRCTKRVVATLRADTHVGAHGKGVDMGGSGQGLARERQVRREVLRRQGLLDELTHELGEAVA
jgi:hypothetical protein